MTLGVSYADVADVEAVAKLFVALDTDGSGDLDRNELSRLVGSFNADINMFLGDLNRTGKLSFNEFYRLLRGKSVPTTWAYRTYWTTYRTVGGSTIIAPST